MKIFGFSLVLLTLIGVLFFALHKKNDVRENKSSFENDKVVAELSYLDKVNQEVLSLEAAKIIFYDSSNELPTAREKAQKKYVLSRLNEKKSISKEALNFINQLPNQDLQQYRLGLIYHDIGLVDEARSCWSNFPSLNSTISMTKSYMKEYNYKKATDIISSPKKTESNFEIMNLAYSLYLVNGDVNNAKQKAKEINEKYGDDLEWLLKSAIMNFSKANYKESCEILESLIFSRQLDVNHLACAHNSRMYLFLVRLLTLPQSEFYIDDIFMAAKQDCKAIFEISGKSKNFSLFIDQKTIEKELAFYQNFLRLLNLKIKPEQFISRSNHIVSRYLSSRIFTQSKKAALASKVLKDWERNRQISMVSGIHYGFLNSPIYMTNSAQTLSNEGMYENSNAILNKLHRKFISFESAKLHNFNQQKIGKKLIFSENQLNKLKVKNEIVQNSKELKKKYKSNQKQIIELARCLRIAKIDKIACKKALSKLISEGNREALVELALIEFTNGNKKGAVNLLERASNYPKTSRASNLNLARIYAQENNLTKIENHLKKLNNDLDPEALIISSLVAYQTKNYPKALSYSQLFIKSHGISQEIMTILANSALHIYKSFPSKPNRRLLEQISKQFTKISNFNNKSFNHAVSSIMLELNKLDLAQKYASKSKNETLIEDIELKMLKNQLISNQITDWASILSKYSQKHSPKAIIEIKISSLIELKELNEAQRLLKELDNGRLNYYQILIHHLNHNYDQRNNLISKTSKPVKMWQILAQLSYKDKFFNEAAACYENALKLEPNNLILSNNYINCAIMNSNSDLNQLLIDANLNYKNFPQPETLNTLVEVLKKSDQDHAIIKLLESQKSLSLKHELLLTKIYQNHAPKKAVALIVKVLSTKGELIDEIEKVELKEWLAVCKINH